MESLLDTATPEELSEIKRRLESNDPDDLGWRIFTEGQLLLAIRKEKKKEILEKIAAEMAAEARRQAAEEEEAKRKIGQDPEELLRRIIFGRISNPDGYTYGSQKNDWVKWAWHWSSDKKLVRLINLKHSTASHLTSEFEDRRGEGSISVADWTLGTGLDNLLEKLKGTRVILFRDGNDFGFLQIVEDSDLISKPNDIMAVENRETLLNIIQGDKLKVRYLDDLRIALEVRQAKLLRVLGFRKITTTDTVTNQTTGEDEIIAKTFGLNSYDRVKDWEVVIQVSGGRCFTVSPVDFHEHFEIIRNAEEADNLSRGSAGVSASIE